jgi:hypothetical protein
MDDLVSHGIPSLSTGERPGNLTTASLLHPAPPLAIAMEPPCKCTRQPCALTLQRLAGVFTPLRVRVVGFDHIQRNRSRRQRLPHFVREACKDRDGWWVERRLTIRLRRRSHVSVSLL